MKTQIQIVATTLLLVTFNALIPKTATAGETSPTITPGITWANSTNNSNQPNNGFVQNNSTFNSLSSCTRSCAFINVDVSENINGRQNTNFTFGAMITDTSLQDKQAQLQAQLQTFSLHEQTKQTLIEKLGEAIERNQPERANAIAMQLAPILGYSDYLQLLRDVKNIDRNHTK